jgi:hypothetical protein
MMISVDTAITRYQEIGSLPAKGSPWPHPVHARSYQHERLFASFCLLMQSLQASEDAASCRAIINFFSLAATTSYKRGYASIKLVASPLSGISGQERMSRCEAFLHGCIAHGSYFGRTTRHDLRVIQGSKGFVPPVASSLSYRVSFESAQLKSTRNGSPGHERRLGGWKISNVTCREPES